MQPPSFPAWPAAEERDKLVAWRLVECIGQILLMARGGCQEGASKPEPPWFSCRVVVAAIYSLAGKGSLEENKRELWAKVGGVLGRQRWWWPAGGA